MWSCYVPVTSHLMGSSFRGHEAARSHKQRRMTSLIREVGGGVRYSHSFQSYRSFGSADWVSWCCFIYSDLWSGLHGQYLLSHWILEFREGHRQSRCIFMGNCEWWQICYMLTCLQLNVLPGYHSYKGQSCYSHFAFVTLKMFIKSWKLINWSGYMVSYAYVSNWGMVQQICSDD